MPLAILPWMQAGTTDGQHFLVMRRCLDDPSSLAYYLVFAPLPAPLSTIVQAIGARWHIEVRRVGAYGIPVRDREGREHKHLQNNGLPGGETHKGTTACR